MLRNWFLIGAIASLYIYPVACQEDTDTDVAGEIPDFVLFDDDFSIEEGVFSDEFEDGKPSDAWFVYDTQYFNDPSVAAPRDPRIPHEQATIYDDPINAEEIEGVLQIQGSMVPPGAGPDAQMVYDPADLRRYKVFTMDPLRGEFQAEFKVVLRGESFSRMQLLFFVREHDWKFDGAREARLAVYGHTSNVIQYEPNWDQPEHYKIQLRSPRIEIEDNFSVQLRRTSDNQIQVWTSEDDSEFEFLGRLGPAIETDLVDVIVGVMADGLGDQPGAITFDSVVVRGPDIPDVEEGTENQALVDYRQSVREDYEIDSAGRFDYGPAAIAANRAFTWMHYMGTNTLYPKVLLPGIPQQGPGQQGQFQIPTPGTHVQPESKDMYEAFLDSQPFARGDSRYLDQAFTKYQEAAQLDPLYGTVSKQMQWLHDVAWDRIVRLLGVFRMRTSDGPTAGGTVQGPGLQAIKKNFDQYVGDNAFANQWDSRIVIFEGTLPKEAKAQVLAQPEPFAVDYMRQYFGFSAEIQKPVDLIGRIPFLMEDAWMTIPLTLYVPDISQEVLARLGFGFGFNPVGGLGVQTAGIPGQGGISGFQGLPGQGFSPYGGGTSNYGQIDPSLLMGRGYTVVEYYGASLGLSDMIVRDELGRIEPKETAEQAFPWLRDYPGLTDIIAEIIDPDQNGSVVLDWNFSFTDLASIVSVPRSDIRTAELQPPEILYDESEIPLLVSENPEIQRRYTFADYFGWDLGPEGAYREPDTPNHIAAFDSPALPETATAQ
ncbi:MAG: hypothetical protein KC931_06315 [Candidatus Omnitrophica bacterium]|nr:hypothetical protein [Candidatus Omnitrophota bacterium]